METFQPALALHFSERLAYRERELRSLLQEVESVAAHVSDVSEGEVVDFKDMAVEETQAVVEHAQAGHAVDELAQVVAARRRLEDGSYGECLDCGEPIDLRRLTALPATRFCTACQAIHEHRRNAP